MKKYITVNVQRVNNATIVVSGVNVQLDNFPITEIPYYEGVTRTEPFLGIIFNIYDIRQTDILTDTVNIDPVTNTNYQYRVIDIPAEFPDMHMEVKIDIFRGSV